MSRRALVVLAIAGWTVALWGLLGPGSEQEGLRERERLVQDRERELANEGDALMKRETELLAQIRALLSVRKAMRAGRMELDWEEHWVPHFMLIPDGEWWAKADGLFVLLSMKEQRGIAVIATADGDSVLDVRLRSGVREGGELIYEFLNSERKLKSSWIARVPDSAEAGGTDDEIDRVVVDRVEGAFRQFQRPFTLFLSELNDPKVMCSAAERKTVERLREVLAKSKRASGR